MKLERDFLDKLALNTQWIQRKVDREINRVWAKRITSTIEEALASITVKNQLQDLAVR